jgi:hypothetical protein
VKGRRVNELRKFVFIVNKKKRLEGWWHKKLALIALVLPIQHRLLIK